MRQFVAVVPWHKNVLELHSHGALRAQSSRVCIRCRVGLAMQDLGIALQTASGDSGGNLDGPPPAPHDWLMKRNCSLSPRQVGWFYLSIFTVSLAIALFFAVQGSWLVLPFAGLDLLGLGIALLVYARHATDYERVSINDGVLVVETASAQRLTRAGIQPALGAGRTGGIVWCAGDAALGQARCAGGVLSGPEQAAQVRPGARSGPAPPLRGGGGGGGGQI